jgi:hypothetical protein
MLSLGLGIASSSIVRRAGGGPSLDLDFLSDTLDSRVSFSRASMAWQTDATGTLTTAPHNLLAHSDFFANSAWVKTACTIVANNAAAPDGTMTADTITFSSGTGLMRQTVGAGVVVAGTTYTFSMWVRLVSGSASINIDINDGTATNITVTTSWSRISWTAAAGAGSGGWIDFRSNAAAVWEIWGAQLEQHPSARPYLSTGVKNLIGFTEAFDNAAWVKTRATVTANQAISPNGLMDADKLIEDGTANNTHFMHQAYTAAGNTTYTYSVFLKAAERTFAMVQVGGFAQQVASNVVYIDLTTGTYTATDPARTTVTSAGDGWWRVSSTVTTISTGGSLLPSVYTAAVMGSASYTGSGSGGIYVWGAQMSASGSLDAYSPNTSAAPASTAYHGPRLDYDPVTKAARGLLVEEARTNLVPGTMSSATYWSVVNTSALSGAISPDGTANAFTMSGIAAGTTNYGMNIAATSIPTITPGPMTGSVFIKAGTAAWFRFIIADATTPTIGAQCYFQPSTGTFGTVGFQSGSPTAISAAVQTLANGWFRISLTATLGTSTTATLLLRMTSANNATTDTGGNTVILYGPQLETGSFASSYIPTTTAAATRAADVATIASLTGWYNQAEGTLFAEIETPSQAANPATGVSFGLSTGAFGDSTYLSHTNSGDYMGVTSGGTTVATVGYGTIQGGVRKVAGAYKLNDFAFSRAGAAVATDTSGAVSAAAVVASLGKGPWGNSNYLGGYIRRVRYWPTRRPNAELQSLTA